MQTIQTAAKPAAPSPLEEGDPRFSSERKPDESNSEPLLAEIDPL
jgi:hypothetical protein